jgi:uncharacterized protein with HEPN domain
MSPDDSALFDIVKAARRILQFVRDSDHSSFMDDIEKQSAVLYQIVIVGEAVKRLTAEFRARHTTVPWRDVAGMRDRVVHGYDDVDLERVWAVATDEVWRLLAQLEPLLPTEEP